MVTTATYLYFRNGLIDSFEVFCLCTGLLALCAQAHLLLLIYYYYYNIITTILIVVAVVVCGHNTD